MAKEYDLGDVRGKTPYIVAKEAGYTGTEEALNAALADMPGHLADKDNPHGVTAEQVGADPAGAAQTVQGNLQAHITDAVKHITAEERTSWNAKAAANLDNVLDEDFLAKANAAGVGGGGVGKRVCRLVVGTSTAGWTEDDCDYLCDGTDDHIEIQAAIDALPETGGEIVVLDGTYQISAGLTIGKAHVAVCGKGSPTVQCLANISNMLEISSDYVQINGLRFSGDNIGNSCIYLSAGKGHEISGNLFTGKSDGMLINGPLVAHGVVHHNHFKDNGYNGITITECDGIIVSENVFDSNKAYGIQSRSQAKNSMAVNNVFVNSGFTGMPRYGVFMQSTVGFLVQGNAFKGYEVAVCGNMAKKCLIVGNAFRENSTGIELKSDSKMSIVANTMLDFSMEGIRANGSGHFIDSNMLINDSYTASMYSIILNGAKNTTVSNNQIVGKNYVEENGSGNVFLNNRFE